MALAIICDSPPAGVVGVPYSHAFPASGGTPPYTFSIVSGALPAGLTLDPATGIVSGTPTTAATSNFTVQVLDAGGVVATVPAAIGTALFGSDFGSSAWGDLAFEYNGVQYAFLCAEGEPSGTRGDQKIHAMHSADGGATWTELDAAHAPAAQFFSYSNTYTAVRDGSIVVMLYATWPSGQNPVTTGGLRIQTFDLATGLWGAITTSSALTLTSAGPVGHGHLAPFIDLVMRGHNDYVLYYTGAGETVAGTFDGRTWSGGGTTVASRLYSATFDGTTFGAETMLPGQAGVVRNFYPEGAKADSAGILHFLFTADNIASTSGLATYHVGMDAAGAFGTVQQITTDNYWGVVWVPGVISPMILFGTPENLGFALGTGVNVVNGNGPAAIRMFYAPAALNPVWTSSVITGDAALANLYAPFRAPMERWIDLAVSGGTIECLWAVDLSGGDETGPFPWYRSQADVATLTWTAPAVFGTAPLALDPGSSGSYPGSSQVFAYPATGGVAVVTVWNDQNYAQATQFSALVPPYAACSITVRAPLTISCGSPPAATVGVPYSHTVPASGGSGSFAFSFTGALPPGLTLDPATGTISGTPTNGGNTLPWLIAFPFTVFVTDTVTSLVASCTTSISASGPGSGGGPGPGPATATIACSILVNTAGAGDGGTGGAGPLRFGKLFPASLTQMGMFDFAWLSRFGTPTRYGALKNDLFFIDRTPAAPGTSLNVTYARMPKTMLATDPTETPAAHAHALADFAVALLRCKEGGQEFTKAAQRHLPLFMDAVKKCAAQVRARSLAQRYDVGPPELERFDISRLLKTRADLPPWRKPKEGQ